MKFILVLLLSSLSVSAFAGQCYDAYKSAKELESIASGVLFVSETDSKWTAFASWEPVSKISESQIKKVLRLKKTKFGEKAYFEMSEDHRELYSFIRKEIESRQEYQYEEGIKSVKKLKKLINTISKKYGKNVRLARYGLSDDDIGYFSGDHMIVIIMDNGCVLGLKADTAWT